MTDKEVIENEEVVDTQETTEEGVKANIDTPNLTIQDLQGLANIIDLAARRGAFQAGDMEAVGASFNKLIGFLSHIAEQQKAATGEEGSTGEADASGAEAPSE